jgi:hypothetical protein
LLVFGAATLAPVAVLPAAGAAATVGAVSGGSVLKKFLSPFKFVSGTDIETVRKLEVEPQVEAMVQSLNVLLTDIEQRGQRPLALIVDGLDKLRDTDAISANFLERRALSAPVCRVVYTAPLDLFYSPVFGSVRAMFPIRPFPHVKLYQRDDVTKEYEEGYVFMDEVVRRRLKTCGHLAETIMPTHVLRTLIAASGGVMRDLIRLVQNAALKADLAGRDQIDDVDAREAAAELRRQLDAQLTPKYREVLRKVNETHQRTDDEECDTLLRSDIVLSYVNKDVWFDSHSALRIPV